RRDAGGLRQRLGGDVDGGVGGELVSAVGVGGGAADHLAGVIEQLNRAVGDGHLAGVHQTVVVGVVVDEAADGGGARLEAVLQGLEIQRRGPASRAGSAPTGGPQLRQGGRQESQEVHANVSSLKQVRRSPLPGTGTGEQSPRPSWPAGGGLSGLAVG